MKTGNNISNNAFGKVPKGLGIQLKKKMELICLWEDIINIDNDKNDDDDDDVDDEGDDDDDDDDDNDDDKNINNN